jgi:hypothetical protein
VSADVGMKIVGCLIAQLRAELGSFPRTGGAPERLEERISQTLGDGNMGGSVVKWF